MSQAISLHSLQEAIRKADDFLGANRVWKDINPLQGAFKHFVEQGLVGPEIESVASLRADEINRFLRERGFDIELGQFAPNDFGTAAVLDVLADWKIVGERSWVTYEGTRYPAVAMSDWVSLHYPYNHYDPNYLFASVETVSGDLVYMAPHEERLSWKLSWVDLLEFVWVLQSKSERYSHADGLIFPMVDMRVNTDLSWMKGYHTVNAERVPVRVGEALQQNRLRLNELGVRAQSGSAIRLEVLGARLSLVIDKPFYLWMTNSESVRPYFVAHITPEDWKDPGDLKTL